MEEKRDWRREGKEIEVQERKRVGKKGEEEEGKGRER